MLEELYQYFLGLFALSENRTFLLWFPSFDNGGFVSSAIQWSDFAPTISIVISIIVFIIILTTIFKMFRTIVGWFFLR